MDERSESAKQHSAVIEAMLIYATIAAMEISLKLEAAGVSLSD